MKNNIEVRFVQSAPELEPAVTENQAEPGQESRTVRGYAAVFSSISQDMGFREVLEPGAIDADTIARSVVLARFNHDDNKILAKCDRGQGSLSLSVDARGLYYTFEAPNTAAGDECLEMIRRGDVSQSSFAFTIADDDWTYADGEYLHTIRKVDMLYDVAPVFNPAYQATTCGRSVIEAHEKRMAERALVIKAISAGDCDAEINSKIEALRNIYAEADAHVRDLTDSEAREADMLQRVIDARQTVLRQMAEDELRRKNENPEKTEKKMKEKKVRGVALLKALRSVLEGKEFSPEVRAIIEEGKAQMGGLATSGQIVIPAESRSLNVATDGEDLVAVEVESVLQPLYGKSVLGQAGAKFLTGLTGDLVIPRMGGSTVGWAGEVTAPETPGDPTFQSEKLQPKRLTAYVDISRQLINQMSESVEALVMNDLANAVMAKLESTILGNENGGTGTNKPKGIFYSTEALTQITNFAGITALEAGVEDANVMGECKYVVSNGAKAALRNMAKSAKTTELVMQNGTIDGTEVLNSSNVYHTTGANGIAYGDFSMLYVGQWGGMDIVVDDKSQAINGVVRLVVNMYYDAVVARPGAIKVATV
ncbi:MAG: phage major capsid protein [Bacteroidales bacterium]|nr:phage major capsid protein [Candidatus Colicola equi]